MANTPWSSCIPQGTSIPVSRGQIQILYAGNKAQLNHLRAEIKRWDKSIESPSPSQRDSLWLAGHATRLWDQAHSFGETALSVHRLKEMVIDNPRVEVSVLAVARASSNRRIIGLCNYRRTWCNSIALDVVTARPDLIDKTASGVGVAFLHHICFAADQIEAAAIWGECTQNSKSFYDKFVNWHKDTEDLMIVPRAAYLHLKQTLEAKWQAAAAAPKNV
ncbi:MAG: hypothetical protein JO307_32110 [Bryobacterales bacterium]|nr:hypothetical protein [Bryobacterales bacterium]